MKFILLAVLSCIACQVTHAQQIIRTKRLALSKPIVAETLNDLNFLEVFGTIVIQNSNQQWAKFVRDIKGNDIFKGPRCEIQKRARSEADNPQNYVVSSDKITLKRGSILSAKFGLGNPEGTYSESPLSLSEVNLQFVFNEREKWVADIFVVCYGAPNVIGLSPTERPGAGDASFDLDELNELLRPFIVLRQVIN